MFRPLSRSHHQGVRNPWELQSHCIGLSECFYAYVFTSRYDSCGMLTNLQRALVSAVSKLQEYFAACVDRDFVVGTATHYGMEGSEIEPRCGRGIFCSLYPTRVVLGPTQPPVRCMTWLCDREWQWTPTPIKRRSQCVGLYLCTSSVFMACYG